MRISCNHLAFCGHQGPSVRSGPGHAAGVLRFLALALAILAFGCGVSAAEETRDTVPGIPFPIGERLRYRIVWGVIPVGKSEAVTEWTEEDGRPLIAIRIRTLSNHVIRTIYPVDSLLETLIDPETLHPVRFTKKSREGRHRSHEVTTFDFTTGVARQHNLRKNRHTEFPIETGTRDLLSFMYFIRGHLFTLGSLADYRVMADEKIYDLVIRAVREEKVDAGGADRVPGMLLEPEAGFEGLFVRKGHMLLWISREIPTVLLRAEVEVPLARVKLILDP